MPTMQVPPRWRAALEETAEELLQQGGVASPPVDCLQLAERLGIVVALDAHQRGRARHKRLGGRPAILLRPEERPERLQWAAAHELGEVAAWRVFERAGDDVDPEAPGLREQVANLMASRLLLPGCWFFGDARRTGGDLLQLKGIYTTASHELIALRFLDAGEPTIVTVFDHGRLVRRRGNARGRPPRLQPPEHRCWRGVHEANRPGALEEGGLRVQGWPVHEPGWKRDVLRTTRLAEAEDVPPD